MSDDLYIFGKEFPRKWLEPQPMSPEAKAKYEQEQKIKRAQGNNRKLRRYR